MNSDNHLREFVNTQCQFWPSPKRLIPEANPVVFIIKVVIHKRFMQYAYCMHMQYAYAVLYAII